MVHERLHDPPLAIRVQRHGFASTRASSSLLKDLSPDPRHLFANLSQRRQAQLKKADAIEKIWLKPLAACFRPQVRGGQETKVTGARLIGTKWHILLLFNRLDEKPLQFAADIAYFVKEQCVAIGNMEQPFPVLSCAGERSFPVAKQLGPHGFGAVLAAGNGWPPSVFFLTAERAVESDPACQGRLPRAALAEQQYRHFEWSEAPCLGKQTFHPTRSKARRIPLDVLFLRRDHEDKPPCMLCKMSQC